MYSNKANIIRKDHQYRFNGELLQIRILKGNTTKLFVYEYDHASRKTKFKHAINGVLQNVTSYAYDGIGRLANKSYKGSDAVSSKQTGNWTDVNTWLSNGLPTVSDVVTINQGQTVTIPTGESASAGKLNDNGILKNNGTLNFGKVSASPLQEITYKYHIRGGLKGINTNANNNLTNSLFSYRLDYENDGVLYDGNIRKQSWKSNVDNIERSYTHSYDAELRLKSSAYKSTKAGENYSLTGVTYDDNGNITKLGRNGATNTNYTNFGNVDSWAYTYPSYSNKLTKIKDLTTTNTDLGDFRDGANTDDDYEYWLDGSLKKDKNKGIDSIKYNYLKLVERVKFVNGGIITYEYDAEGTKLKKIVSGGETTDYEEDDIYVNGVLY